MARSEIGRTGARFGTPPSRHAPDPEYPHGRPPEPTPESDSGSGPTVVGEEPEPESLVGVTGARFGGHSAKRTRLSRRERAARRAAARAGAEGAGAPSADGAPGNAAATPGGIAPENPDAVGAGLADTAPLPMVAGRPDGPATAGPGHPSGAAAGTDGGAAGGSDSGAAGGTGGGAAGASPQVPAFAPVRPYVMTGGRTRVRAELRLETLVSVRPAPGPAPRAESVERATVLRLCARPRSVSEVAALAAVPLGVARVLIDDLASEGRLVVHGVSSAEDGPSVALMDRVLAGLRRL
ncbi:multi-component regulatory system-6 [Pseudonocardia sp. Ae717_Ps2]|uniref:DUF742 domain-containing protein n=1 Tax=Pseudonocardia sp. Ae717_Ps2 TaxID=1885573 RepID=UPI00094AD144|nr:DUF742 domain-containing protein [Pseudonocardia sp. Ae717_Ps2]OLM31597.1 multi-component regulatory system-6 [Pseudonocardia sp. Ae717_Ps2]